MQDKVVEVVAKVIGIAVAEVHMDSTPATIEEWDSLKHMRIILALEELFNIEFSFDQISDLDCVSKIVNAVEELKK